MYTHNNVIKYNKKGTYNSNRLTFFYFPRSDFDDILITLWLRISKFIIQFFTSCKSKVIYILILIDNLL